MFKICTPTKFLFEGKTLVRSRLRSGLLLPPSLKSVFRNHAVFWEFSDPTQVGYIFGCLLVVFHFLFSDCHRLLSRSVVSLGLLSIPAVACSTVGKKIHRWFEIAVAIIQSVRYVNHMITFFACSCPENSDFAEKSAKRRCENRLR